MKRGLRQRYNELKHQIEQISLHAADLCSERDRALEVVTVLCERIESYREERKMLRKQLEISVKALQKSSSLEAKQAIDMIKKIKPHTDEDLN